MPPTAEQAPQAQTQAHTTVTQAPAGGQPDARAQDDLAQPTGMPAEPAGESPAPAVQQGEQAAPTPGFGERGRMRRRSRFLRKARELAYRDLGGLVYDLHRFGQRNDQVVLAKLATLGHIDAELRALEDALHEIKPVTVLREVGIAACPRCAAIHGDEDRFCPGCGLAFDAGADRPLSTAPVTATPQGDASTPTAEPSRPAAVPGIPAPTSSPAPTGPPAPASSPAPTGPPAPANSPAPTSPSAPTTSPAPTSSPAPRPAAAEPLTRIERPAAPAPVLRPTTPPAAARPQTADEGNGKGEPEDEPTQILRPPAGGA
jgi:hypothetical protein